MTKEILRRSLALDSLCPYLHFSERIAVHKFINRNQKDSSKLPLKVRQAILLIKKHDWERPKWDFNDRVRKYYDTKNNQYQNISRYKHPIINEIEKLK